MTGIKNIDVNKDWLYHKVTADTIDKIILSGKIKSRHILNKEDKRKAKNNIWNGNYYISLAKPESNEKYSAYRRFILGEYALVLEDVEAIKTKFKEYNELRELINKLPLKKRYSFWKGEYQVKDFISIDKVVGIKIPSKHYRFWPSFEEDDITMGIDEFLRKMDLANSNLPFIDVEEEKLISKDNIKEYMLKR